MIGVFIIPTGIGCTIGGHSGDSSPAAKLVASVCDKLIVHPNVVNASDINEMTENMVYVEGSMLNRFLAGEIELRQSLGNKILVAVNAPLDSVVINAVSASRVTLGADIKIVVLDYYLTMRGSIKDNRAKGEVYGWNELCSQMQKYDFDVLAIYTKIDVNRDVKLNYYKHGGINPWGGVEAICSKLVSQELGKPAVHAPVEDVTSDDEELFLIHENEVVDPRIAPEAISIAYLHCVLKGLHKAPLIGKGLSVNDIDFLITPIDCVGPPHKICLGRGIPIIAVKENKTVLNDSMPDTFIIVENYLEAVGMISCIKTGIMPELVRRPVSNTVVLQNHGD